jgi:hypothetical protein
VISKFFGVVMSGRKKIADFDPLSSSKTMNAKEPGENDLEFTYIIPLLHFHEQKVSMRTMFVYQSIQDGWSIYYT